MKKVLLVLAILAIAASAHAVTNLLPNGDFSNGLTGWVVGNSSDTDVHFDIINGSTNPCAGFTTGTQCNFYGTWIYTVITGLAIGNTYTIKADYGGSITHNYLYDSFGWWSVGLFPGAYDHNNMRYYSPYAIKQVTLFSGSSGLEGKASKTWLATQSTYTFYMMAGVQRANYFDAYLDNVVLTPEPSSLLALGTGLFGLIGFSVRRRR